MSPLAACLGALVGMVIGAIAFAHFADERDANRVKAGYMITSSGIYKLTEIKP